MTMAIDNSEQWIELLERQRRKLKMTLPALAQRSGLSLATIRRILLGKSLAASFANVIMVAHALGTEFRMGDDSIIIHIRKADDIVADEIRARARKIVEMVQGTMALESQGLTDAADVKELF